MTDNKTAQFQHSEDCPIIDSNLGPCFCGADKRWLDAQKSDAEKAKFLTGVLVNDYDRLNIGGKIYVKERQSGKGVVIAENLKDATAAVKFLFESGSEAVFISTHPAPAPDVKLLDLITRVIAERQPTEHGFFYLPDHLWLELAAATERAQDKGVG